MGHMTLRRRRSAFAAGLAALAVAVGLAAAPAQAAPPAPVAYVALGDSYTAGTGAGDPFRPAGVACWQSHPGYVDDVGQTGRVNLVANAACHGAVLSNASPFYDTGLYTPTVEDQLFGLAVQGKISAATGLVSITAGANDLGFSYVIGVCATNTQEVCAAVLQQASAPAALQALNAGLVQTYAAIHSAAPRARIAVMGYPLLFDPASPFAPIPPANQTLVNQAALALNSTVAAAAGTANAVYQANTQYVDVTARFMGHAVNSTDPWVQLNPSLPTADYNFHPNKAGHARGYAAALMGAIKPALLARQ
ncbi:SGNH/GDSL hydrolase family protein [Pseudarthrobacter sp. Y6]|uniref:SGNH/GDSL hydrolase family protein n=1 Tax=Pseudarthrobacter sp. Y6 TaxID=3418422 RepID=UPI003CE8E3C0